jgi:hypothetical protein
VTSLIVTDRQLMEAIDFDRLSAERLRACVERAMLAEGGLKRSKALEMQKHVHLPLGAQEREAYASDTFALALAEEAAAAAELEEVKARRSHARLTIDIWRVLETSYRSVSQYP